MSDDPAICLRLETFFARPQVFVPRRGWLIDWQVDQGWWAHGVLEAAEVDGDSLRFKLVSRPTHGVAVLTNAAAGTYIYKPRRNFDGTDSFTFQATDGTVRSNVATVFVTVRDDDDREKRRRKGHGR